MLFAICIAFASRSTAGVISQFLVFLEIGKRFVVRARSLEHDAAPLIQFRNLRRKTRIGGRRGWNAADGLVQQPLRFAELPCLAQVNSPEQLRIQINMAQGRIFSNNPS